MSSLPLIMRACTPGYDAEAFEVFCDNLARWVRGAPLTNVVDKTAGY